MTQDKKKKAILGKSPAYWRHAWDDVKGRATNNFFGILTWGFVRGLGELRILTKASYVLIAFVPMLASLWPAVRVAINQYNATAAHANRDLRNLSQAIDEKLDVYVKTAAQLTPSDSAARERAQIVTEELSQLSHEMSQRAVEFADSSIKPIEEKAFPKSWALLFYAGLLVAIGHLAYQLWAPSDVKAQSGQEFVQSQIRAYQDTKSEVLLQELAIYYATESGDVRLWMLDPDMNGDRTEISDSDRTWYKCMKFLASHGVWGAVAVELMDEFVQKDQNLRELAPFDSGAKDRIEQLTDDYDFGLTESECLAIVDRGAWCKYSNLSTRNMAAIVVAIPLYAIAMWNVAQVLFLQVRLVQGQASL